MTELLLAKIRSTDRLLGVSGRRGVEPMRVGPPDGRPGLALDGRPEWFMVETDPEASPWDQAHARVASQLGIDESDVLFVEPDRVHDINEGFDETGGLGLDECPDQIGQDNDNGKATGDGFAWHLGADHSQLRLARAAVSFTGPRTRVAHIDTGFWPDHQTTPIHINDNRQWNFVGRDGRPTSATDPDNKLLIMDNSGHGTGTLSVLAGGMVTGRGVVGGAPGAEIVPLRIADTVMLLRTSALAMAIRYAAYNECAVASLSMGGWPSQAWAEAVDEAYEKGLCLVAAGGNRFRPGPPRSLVYPARYPRVIAVTGAMANGQPYDDLDLGTMQGSFGPDSAMETAMAAYTPNIPWAKFGCAELTRLDGEGTSAATPQVAAAAALWIEHHKDVLPRNWKRVEAVRHALFSSTKSKSRYKDFYGNGILQANDALAVRPKLDRDRTKRSTHRWAVWRMLTGLGIDGESAREQMFNLELAQLWMTNERLAELVPDPETEGPLSADTYEAIAEAIFDDSGASTALRHHLDERVGQLIPSRVLIPDFTEADDLAAEPAAEPTADARPSPVPSPSHRRLRVYAKDPTLATSLATSPIGEVTLRVPWEQVEATPHGFRGEYIEILEDEPEGKPIPTGAAGGTGAVGPDGNPSAGPGLLDDPRLLGQDGWPPSPSNLYFHQQMVYAVTTRTVEHFERALGRPVQWRPTTPGAFQQRLLVRPHALQAANAFYSPDRTALLFGSFHPPADDSRTPNMAVHTCLSYDIIAHETTHAVLDGMYGSFTEPTNPDVLAFHEAFSDLVALLQSFDLTELLEHQIRGSRGDLKAETLLGKLAVQFGEAVRGREALRSAIGTVVDGEWVRSAPDPTLLHTRTTPHARGAVLVSAIFDALIGIYEGRTADLFRIASGGTDNHCGT
ncbi:MAG: S8 family serine peptidase [Actinomycetota bacterium]